MTTYAARSTKVRRLVAADEVTSELDAEARRAVGELWSRRAEGELATAVTFAGLYQDCLTGGVDARIARQTQRAVDDERFHAELCSMLAEHYLGRPVAPPATRADPLRFASCTPEVAPALRFLLHCALNETVAVAYLQQCYREAASKLVRETLRELLHDEVEHSRAGWAFVASVVSRPAVRSSFCRELPALLALVSDAWQEPAPGPGYPVGHGALSAPRTREVTQQALDGIVRPGLARFGIEAAP